MDESVAAVSSSWASIWQRALAWGLDALVVTFPYVILRATLGLTGALVGSVASCAYFILLEGGPRGQTLGKQLVGIRVQRLDGGSPVGFRRAFVRVLAKGILVFGYVWPLWDPAHQALHDKAADTAVIRWPQLIDAHSG
jgi:uncharacterized RDD family membrane protein YckC